MADLIQTIRNRVSQLKDAKTAVKTSLDDIERYVFGGLTSKDPKVDVTIYDDTATSAHHDLAESLLEDLISPSTRWFAFKPSIAEEIAAEGDTDELDRWYQACTDVVYAQQNASQSYFYTECSNVIAQVVGYGTGCLSMEEDLNSNLEPIEFRCQPLNNLYIDTDKKTRRVSTIALEEEMMVCDVVAKFPDAKSDYDAELESNPYKKVTITWLVVPTYDFLSDTQNPSGMPFSSWYVDLDKQLILSEGGFNEQGIIVPRMYTYPGSAWGRSPITRLLPTIRMVNNIEKANIVAAQMAIDPPMDVVVGSYLHDVKMIPGIRNIRNEGTEPAKPMLVPGLFANLQEQEARRQRIRMALLAHRLNLPDEHPQMTAAEVMVRNLQRLRQLYSSIVMLKNEFIDPMMTRWFAINLRRGLFPEPPNQVAQAGKVDFRVDISSQISRAQQIQQLSQAQSVLEVIAVLQQFAPEILDNYNFDEYSKLLNKANEVPMSMIRSKKEVKEIRAKRQQAMQQQQQLVMQQAQAGITKDNATAGREIAQGDALAAQTEQQEVTQHE